jgi:hypothetical protein
MRWTATIEMENELNTKSAMRYEKAFEAAADSAATAGMASAARGRLVRAPEAPSGIQPLPIYSGATHSRTARCHLPRP